VDLNQLPFYDFAVPTVDTAAPVVQQLYSAPVPATAVPVVEQISAAVAPVSATITHQTVWVPFAADMDI
jgi:hypothetical protein